MPLQMILNHEDMLMPFLLFTRCKLMLRNSLSQTKVSLSTKSVVGISEVLAVFEDSKTTLTDIKNGWLIVLFGW